MIVIVNNGVRECLIELSKRGLTTHPVPGMIIVEVFEGELEIAQAVSIN